ncbi:MAG: translation initiation factor Sui1 [Synergistetes bacterium ADurb.Bin520]|nr:MAG: translation initiation factor Sui1 [Synergistetes bacterium ADurb.Bin520]
MPQRPSGHRPVYSTAHGRLCPDCGKPAGACACKMAGAAPVGDGIVRVGRETKGRKGAGVTVVTGLPLDAGVLAELAGRLKRLCGAGGTVRGGVIEIQGEHRDRLAAELAKLGYTVKKAGG